MDARRWSRVTLLISSPLFISLTSDLSMLAGKMTSGSCVSLEIIFVSSCQRDVESHNCVLCQIMTLIFQIQWKTTRSVILLCTVSREGWWSIYFHGHMSYEHMSMEICPFFIWKKPNRKKSFRKKKKEKKRTVCHALRKDNYIQYISLVRVPLDSYSCYFRMWEEISWVKPLSYNYFYLIQKLSHNYFYLSQNCHLNITISIWIKNCHITISIWVKTVI